MSFERRLEQDLPALLEGLAQPTTPDYRDHIVHQVAGTQQRPTWMFPERWVPMTDHASRATRIPRVPIRAAALVALLLLALVVGLVLAGGQARRVPTQLGTVSNGWITVSANPWDINGGESGDIYLLSDIGGPRRIVGAGGDGVAQACPRFSPDGERLAYGEARAGGPATNNMRRFWLVTDRAVVVVGVNSLGSVSTPIVRV